MHVNLREPEHMNARTLTASPAGLAVLDGSLCVKDAMIKIELG